MTFDPQEYFTLGNALHRREVATASDVAQFRSAIGRAYYACFLTARESMFGVDGRPRRRRDCAGHRRRDRGLGSHERVIEDLRHHPRVSGAKRLADQLEQLKAFRREADYVMDDASSAHVQFLRSYGITDWESASQTSLTLASHLLPALRSIPRC